MLVPVDFERDDLGEMLVGAGFQQNSPAFFTWLGVVPYLSQDAIGSTLDYMGRVVQGLAPGQAGLHVVHAKH